MQPDETLLRAFCEEAEQYVPVLRSALEACGRGDFAPDGLPNIHRLAHNLKGASAMVALEPVTRVATLIEVQLADCVERQAAPGAARAKPLLRCVDALESWLAAPDTGVRVLDACWQEVHHELQTLGEPGTPVAKAPKPDDANDELREIFRLEAEEHLEVIGGMLPRWTRAPEDRELLLEIRRAAHTLKGSAGMVGLQDVQHIAHRMEDVLDALYDGACSPGPNVSSVLFEMFDVLESAAHADGVTITVDEALEARVVALLAGSTPEEAAPRLAPQVADTPPLEADARAPSRSDDLAPAQETSEVMQTSPMMRVSTERLGDLVNTVSELVINRSAFERRLGQLSTEIEELAPNVRSLRQVSGRLETEYELATLGSGGEIASDSGDFDELEMDQYTEFHSLSRSVQERIDDISAVQGSLQQLVAELDQVLNSQRQLSSEIHDGLMRLRMVPFQTISGKLERTSQQTAATLGREVAFRLHGGGTELDKSVLDRLADPLLHVIRNAVDHGLEPAAEREAIGKPRLGLIQVSVAYEGTQVVVRVRDDGRGAEPSHIRQQAVDRGLMTRDQADALSDDAAINLLFAPGFSTANEVSEISGRGVGMDVVRTSVEKLDGTVRFASSPGRGSTLTIRLPIALAIMRTLTVETVGEYYAVPLASVDRVIRLPWQDVEGRTTVDIDGEELKVQFLDQVLGCAPRERAPTSLVSVLLTKSFDATVAIVVDRVERSQEVVVKDFASHARRVPGCLGGTISGDGDVMVILDTEVLAERGQAALRETELDAVLATSRRSTVMLVDDSLSVRRIVSSQLEAAGYEVQVAVDGSDALETLEAMKTLPDAIVLDVEMPKMDGFELLGLLRRSERYRDIPVAFQTSRAGQRHRQRAAELGAQAYLVKPYDDRTLTETLRSIIRPSQ